MKVLFDQNAPRPLAGLLTKHEVMTAAEMGWARLRNGDLLNAAEADGFDAMVTADRDLAYQQNLSGRKLALVILPVGRWPKLQPYLEQVVEAVDRAKEGGYYVVGARGIDAMPKRRQEMRSRR